MRCMFWHASKSKRAVFCMRNPSPHAEGVLRGHPSHHTPAVVLCGSGAFPQLSLRPGFLLPRRGWPGCGAAPRSTGPGRPAPAVGANMEGGGAREGARFCKKNSSRPPLLPAGRLSLSSPFLLQPTARARAAVSPSRAGYWCFLFPFSIMCGNMSMGTLIFGWVQENGKTTVYHFLRFHGSLKKDAPSVLSNRVATFLKTTSFLSFYHFL